MAEPPITPEQMRDARVLIGWSRERLGAQSETTSTFIRTYEGTGRIMGIRLLARTTEPLAAIRATLETAGVEFTNGNRPGCKLSKHPKC